MKKKIEIVLRIFIIIGIIILCMSYIRTYGFSVNDITGTETTELDSFGNGIIKIFSTAGSICSVIVLVILGIKYMIGSVEERAEYKKSLLPYVVGAFLVFASSTIAGIIYSIIP